MYQAFIDLDELIVRCRDKQAKKFIQEAVACYRAGAYRSSIVATWNAVVFDFLHKLKELELFGDGKASKLLEKFEKLRLEKKVKELWEFESNIPKVALTEFELISVVEQSDIERLFEDRSRCAHPSMISLEEPFEATAELARYHLRSAVMHLLERPPVQGRAARERIFQDIKSEYFPTEKEKAINHFKKSPLARARFNLIKDVVIGLTTSLLIEDLPEDERKRQFSAINAISSMYSQQTRDILNDKLSNIIINKVSDSNWNKVIIYLANVQTWDTLTQPCELKAVAFIESIEIFEQKWHGKSPSINNIEVLLKAYCIDFLKQTVMNKFQIPLTELLSIKKLCDNELKYDSINKIIKPLLEKHIPKASFNELILMIFKEDESFNDKMKPYLAQKIKNVSLEDLLYELVDTEDIFIKDLCEKNMQFIFDKTPLEDLLEVRKYNMSLFSDQTQIKIIELSEQLIENRIKEVEFDDLLSIQSNYKSDKLFCELIKPILRKNYLKIVSKFILSFSYENAALNASLLLHIVDILNAKQWESILKAFCENSQIYNSFDCPGTFQHLFIKSVDIERCVQSYWLTFRENLNLFNNNNKGINRLKQVIDSYVSD